MLYPFSKILFYKVMWWFDGQNIGMEPKLNPMLSLVLGFQ
jgi:hypothetical protein